MSTDHRAGMKYQIHSVAVSTIVTEVRTIRLEVTDPEVYTDINGKQWLPATAYLEYRRTNGGPWKIHKSIARGTSIKRDGSRGAQNFKEARIDSDAGRDRDDATKYGDDYVWDPSARTWNETEAEKTDA